MWTLTIDGDAHPCAAGRDLAVIEALVRIATTLGMDVIVGFRRVT